MPETYNINQTKFENALALLDKSADIDTIAESAAGYTGKSAEEIKEIEFKLLALAQDVAEAVLVALDSLPQPPRRKPIVPLA